MKIRRLNIINILVLFLCCIIMGLTWNVQGLSILDISQMSTAFVLLLGAYHAAVLRVEKYQLVTFQVVFMGLQYVFLFGHVVLYALGLYSKVSWKLMERFEAEDILKGISYAVCYLQAIFTGLVWRRRRYLAPVRIVERLPYQKSWRLFVVGVACILMFFPFKLYYDATYMRIVSQSTGYISSSEIPINGMIYCFSNLALIGFIYLICSKCLKRPVLFGVLGVLLVYLVYVMSKTGDRRYAVCGLLALLLCYLYCYNVRIGFKNIVLFLVAAVVGLSFVSVISGIRRQGLVSLPELWKLIKQNIVEENMIFEVFAEFGVTLFSFVFPIMYYPATYAFKLGVSFLSDIITILPVGGVLGAFTEASNVARPINRLTNAHVGGSLGGELYGNFGFVSIPIAVLLGMLLAKLFNKETVDIRLQNERHALNVAIYYSLLYICLNLVRAAASEATRAGTYAVIVPLFVFYFLKALRRDAP